MLLACIFGVLEPALACVSSSDCCPAGCSGQTQPGSGWVGIEACCAIQAPLGTSLSLAPQSRQAVNVAGSSPALIALAGPVRLVPTHEIRATRAATTCSADHSLTYLHTARLRL